ncbi:MAG: hypothetical protein IPJ88_16955 [Myxococcales bacterium]|nr:MAG: hypothetical protein IPJ88_16955 [Myxococcales bacterium]
MNQLNMRYSIVLLILSLLIFETVSGCGKREGKDTPSVLGKLSAPTQPKTHDTTIEERSSQEDIKEQVSQAFAAQYPLLGTVEWHIARIYSEPKTTSAVAGAARRGTFSRRTG